VEEIAQHRADVHQREADLVKAQTLLDKRSAVVCLGGVTQQDYDDALKDRDAAAAQLEAARQILRKDINGPRKEDIWASRANVAAAKAALSQAKTQLSYTKLYAPSAGIIQTRVVEPGAVVSAGQTVFALALDSPKWVWAYLEETDLGRVRAGMKADILTDARPKKPYKAHIGYISPTAEFTPKNVETRQLRTALVYPIRLVVQDPDNILRQGSPASYGHCTYAAEAFR
jgi:HlyD family secretion protein